VPTQPPRFRPPGAKPATAGQWARPGRNAKRRLRGRAGVADRKRILAEEPLCRVCLAEGRTRPSEEVDHINPDLPNPLWDARENKQGICKPCHKAKTATESVAAKLAERD
jgi:5-methylcytosine-specific restriction protein A